MYIEFTLPQGAGGLAAAVTQLRIDKELKEWHEVYGIPYKLKRVKYIYKLTMGLEKDYQFFMLSWNPTYKSEWLNYRVVEPMKS